MSFFWFNFIVCLIYLVICILDGGNKCKIVKITENTHLIKNSTDSPKVRNYMVQKEIENKIVIGHNTFDSNRREKNISNITSSINKNRIKSSYNRKTNEFTDIKKDIASKPKFVLDCHKVSKTYSKKNGIGLNIKEIYKKDLKTSDKSSNNTKVLSSIEENKTNNFIDSKKNQNYVYKRSTKKI